MKFLTKFGQIALRVIGVISGVGPMVANAIPGTKDDAIIANVVDSSQQIGGIIQQAEIFGQALGLKGLDKLKGASPAVQQIILQSAALAGHKVAQEELFRQGCSKITDGWADVFNSLHEDGVKVQSKT